MTLRLHPIATALPPGELSQRDAAELTAGFCCSSKDERRLLDALFRRAGVRTRRSVLLQDDGNGLEPASKFSPARDSNDRGPGTAERMELYRTEAPRLAVRAAAGALRASGFEPETITHLVTASCTGFFAPGPDLAVQNALELPSTTRRVHVGFMGCAGALNALSVANGLVHAEPDARVLVVAVELCSIHAQYGWNPDRVVANALFADGAAALVATHSDTANDKTREVLAFGSKLFPESEREMTWEIGDNGFVMSLSARVPELIRSGLRPWLEGWLEEHGLRPKDIGAWAIHPGGPRILSAVEESLGLPREATALSREVLAEHGNMSSPTVLFLLERLARSRSSGPILALGFSPGLTAEAVLLRQ